MLLTLLPRLLARLGCSSIVFLFTDQQIFDERALVYINDLLAQGCPPGLFAEEDKDELLNAVRAEAKAAGVCDSR